eukprot:CAMPEP_0119331008 /NCGR_PEP_ID=MMETSP1333-20130426/79542_1 /TAXON_ID=418940 /ORGANISM="Scyphosphaera apsteinii, Strain RCC1455" /LENGTH=40 /DNA_ID= /DNA_START= /DNA_END= /DNA_ORIENTATION=
MARLFTLSRSDVLPHWPIALPASVAVAASVPSLATNSPEP